MKEITVKVPDALYRGIVALRNDKFRTVKQVTVGLIRVGYGKVLMDKSKEGEIK